MLSRLVPGVVLVLALAGCGSAPTALSPSEVPSAPALPPASTEPLTGWAERSDARYGTIHYRVILVEGVCFLETQESFKGTTTHVAMPCPEQPA